MPINCRSSLLVPNPLHGISMCLLVLKIDEPSRIKCDLTDLLCVEIWRLCPRSKWTSFILLKYFIVNHSETLE